MFAALGGIRHVGLDRHNVTKYLRRLGSGGDAAECRRLAGGRNYLGHRYTDAVKTGMLSNSGIIAVVAEKVQEHGLSTLVVDPVMVAKGGA